MCRSIVVRRFINSMILIGSVVVIACAYASNDNAHTECVIRTENGRQTNVISLLVIKAAYTSQPLIDTQQAIAKSIEHAAVADKCDVNALDNYGLTPLHIAVSKNLDVIVKSLIKLGADPGIRVQLPGSKLYGMNITDINTEELKRDPTNLPANHIHELLTP
jgi:hypothetical protein